MMMRVLVGFCFLSLAGVAESSDKQIWACSTEHVGARPIIHLVEWGERSYLKFANTRIGAVHRVEEDLQGWYWNNEGNGYYRFGVRLNQNGTAWFHDFSARDDGGFSPPLDHLVCRRDA